MRRLSETVSRVIGKSALIRRERRLGLLITPNFKRLVWAMLAMQSLSILIGAFQYSKVPDGALGAAAFFLGINAWLSWKLIRGRIWARVLFLLLQPMMITLLFFGARWTMAPNVAYIICLAGLVGMMLADLLRLPVARALGRWRRWKDGSQEGADEGAN
jgi:hypothetical protein